ncbi:MAG TPA: peptidoglycan DD-metalloendopeptidase family protein, partial [Gemmataceae bacterium]|nr:peptidoglycan DD-metalloendopeptidase family protein [Gemmataceae bacterium]
MSPRRRPSLIGTLLQLEERTAPANLRLTGVVLVDATNAPEANPVYGQNTFVRAEWASEAMAGTEPAVPVRYTANFPVNYFFPGSSAVSYPADSAAINLGTGSGSWSTYRGGWYAGTAPFTITITLDPNNQIAETDETDNTLTVTVTPITPTDLPMKFLRQIQTTPNRDWSITNYVDVDPRAQSFADYQLGAYTYDGHDAIDAGPWNFAAQDAGIPVTAVADGVVDQIDGGNNFDRETALNNRPWNAVWINHGNGWRTVYAHLAAGSITVKVGDPVTVGRVLGLMGSSGDSNGTHAHYTAYYRGAQIEAGFSLSTYWINPLPYGGDVPGFYLESGIADHSPFQFAGESQEKVAQYTSVGVNSPGSQNMFFYVQGYNLKTTDVMYFQWVRPDGSVLNTSSFSPSGNFTYSSWWWSRPQAAFQTSPGTWQIVYYLNGTNPAHEQRRQSFAVVNGTGAGSLRMTDSAGSPVIDGRTTPIDFGSAVAGGSPVQKSFTLFNTAFGSLTLGNFVLPPGFSLVSAPASIAGNGSGVVILQMDTTAVGLKFGSVRFDTNDPDIGMFEFVVSGTVTGSVPTGSPVIGLGAAAALEFASGSPALVLAPTATLTDPDSISFNSLAVELATFGGPDDRLAIRNQGTGTGQIGLGATGPTVLYEGGPIGTFAGGTGTTPLVVTLGSNATLAATQALLRNITYRNVSTAPSSQRKAVRFTLTDDTGLASNQLIQHVINTPDTAPTIRSNGGGPTAAVSVPENTTAVTNVVSVDPDPGQPLNYTLAGPDAARFQISPTGVLTFATAPDFENPTDVGANNVYEVTVQVSDGLLTATQAIAVTVTDVAAGSLQFAASNYATAEGNSGTTNVTLTITRTGGNDAT